jgi:hypothetical protein
MEDLVKFEQKAQDKRAGMSLAELKQFIERVERLGVSGHDRIKANSIKLQTISVTSDPEVWSD